MAQRFGGKYSPDGKSDDRVRSAPAPRISAQVDPVSGKSNALFAPGIVLFFTTFSDGAAPLALGLSGAVVWMLGAWLLRDGLRAAAAYDARKVARRPALPRKTLAAILAGLGSALAVAAHSETFSIGAPLIFAICTSALHVAAFGLDPFANKGAEGIDDFQQSRVAEAVDEAEKHLRAMSDAILRTRDRQIEARVERFQDTARDLFRTVESDPRDLTGARKYLTVYLQGARDASIKFADLYAHTPDAQARSDFEALLDDLESNFAARTRKMLQNDHSDLTVEIEVLRDRLKREGVRLD